LQKLGQKINDRTRTCGCRPVTPVVEATVPPVKDLDHPEISALESEKLKLVGWLAGSIAHDLNNPLCGVHSVLERFARKFDMPDAEQHLLQLALQQCERMKLLLQDVQEFIHDSSPEHALFDLGTVVTTVLRLMHKQLKLAQIVVHPLAEQEPILLMGCKDQIKQMLLHLFVALCRRLDANRCEITLRVVREQKWLRLMWQFHVAPGDAMGGLEHLFAELTKSDCTLDSGLGMAHAVVECHGGTIHLSTNAEGPKVMVVSFPIEQYADERGWCGAGSRTDSR